MTTETKQWAFTEKDLEMAVCRRVKTAIDTGHPAAIKNAQFIGQQFIKMLKEDNSLHKGVEKRPQDYDINNMDDFKKMIGMDMKDIGD
jgi:hypothetical protein